MQEEQYSEQVNSIIIVNTTMAVMCYCTISIVVCRTNSQPIGKYVYVIVLLKLIT